MKACVLVYGCQMNKYDGGVIKAILEKDGIDIVDDYQNADVVILNGCCVRKRAEERILRKIKEIRQRKGNEIFVGVCGCIAQLYKDKFFDFNVDFVIGPDNILFLPGAIKKVIYGEKPSICELSQIPPNYISSKLENKIKTFLPVSYGCDNYCSYCIVPFVRGRKKEREPQQILLDIRKLHQEGIKEVTLLGQDITAYNYKGLDFPELLKQIASFTDMWIKFITSHPLGITEKLIEVIKDFPNIGKNLHIPLQSGSDKILKLMNRGYSSSYYKKIVEMIRGGLKDCCVTTDILVGFPNETQEDFIKTYELLREIEFDAAFVFIYSPRPMTEASKLPDNVPEIEKKRRLNELVKLQIQITRKKNQAQINKIKKVLIEGKNRKQGGMIARDLEDKVVIVVGDSLKEGEFVNVRIQEAGVYYLKGAVVSK